MARPFDSDEGACKFCRDRGGGVRPGGVKNVGSKGRQKIIFHVIFKFFLCRLPVCVYSVTVYVNGVFEFQLIINMYIKYNSI